MLRNSSGTDIPISTGGASPALAKKIRGELEKKFGGEYGTLVELMGKIRPKLLPRANKAAAGIFASFVRSPVLSLIRRRNRAGVDRLLKRYFGNLSLHSLGVRL